MFLKILYYGFYMPLYAYTDSVSDRELIDGTWWHMGVDEKQEEQQATPIINKVSQTWNEEQARTQTIRICITKRSNTKQTHKQW